ncbi:hypothetical protein O6H91_22G054300 [Diphasiastrum complanatum]|uniref:Uncharacterized protein n=1 Tax=Diphasiastrum complanatum TaxID=34168 RepID=A0ACC2AFU0_DIPCM|nr:hypothetical protein O6H91_22G054300 [Diphasiastrum complanatum]
MTRFVQEIKAIQSQQAAPRLPPARTSSSVGTHQPETQPFCPPPLPPCTLCSTKSKSSGDKPAQSSALPLTISSIFPIQMPLPSFHLRLYAAAIAKSSEVEDPRASNSPNILLPPPLGCQPRVLLPRVNIPTLNS